MTRIFFGTIVRSNWNVFFEGFFTDSRSSIDLFTSDAEISEISLKFLKETYQHLQKRNVEDNPLLCVQFPHLVRFLLLWSSDELNMECRESIDPCASFRCNRRPLNEDLSSENSTSSCKLLVRSNCDGIETAKVQIRRDLIDFNIFPRFFTWIVDHGHEFFFDREFSFLEGENRVQCLDVKIVTDDTCCF